MEKAIFVVMIHTLPEVFTDIFEPALLKEMLRDGQFVKIPAGSALIDVGQTIRAMPIVLTGSLKVTRIDEQGNELLLYYITSQESCAMSFTCCMGNQSSEIRAIAEEDTEVISLPTALMEEWITRFPTWKSFVMQTIRQRFHELLRTIDQVAFQKLDDRLVYYLREKSKATQSSLINLSHQQIADELGTARVVISRLLKKLENDKKVLLYRNQIKILNLS